MKTRIAFTAAILISLLTLNSCGVTKALTGKSTAYYPGTATLADGEQKVGFFEMPLPNSSVLKLYSEDNGQGAMEAIPSKEVVELQMYNPTSPKEIAIFEYLTVRGKDETSRRRWVHRLTKADYLTVYIGAEEYIINPSGEVELVGTKQVINHGANRGMMISQPSFPVYMKKNDDKVLSYIGVRGGVEFEASSLRSGMVRFLADDPQLCDYILDKKPEYKHIGDIARLYNPNRGDAPLVIEGMEFSVEKKFLTNVFDKELIYTLELGKTLNENHGIEFGLGIRSSIAKFISYGGDVGVAMIKTVDEVKRLENHPMNLVNEAGGWENIPVIPEDLTNGAHFRFNTFIGGQLPMDLGKMYLIPAAQISLGGMFGSNYSALNYGPMFNLDLAFPMKHGSFIFIGAGYRHSIPLVSDENRHNPTHPNYDAYAPINTVSIRISYKF